MNENKAVLILGLFVNPSAQHQNIQTAEDRLAAMFRENGINVITSSSKSGKLERLTDTIKTIISKRNAFNTAIVPLFGTWPSFLWQEAATRLLKLFNKKIILGVHGGSIPERIEQGATRFYKAMKRADVLYAPSPYFSDLFKSKGFNINVVENPVDYTNYHFCIKEKIRPRLLWMRAFTDVYNPLMAIHVAKKMAEKYPDFKMVMAGKDGPLTDATKKLVDAYGLNNKVHFPGYINMQQKQQYAQDYDIYICTNNIDNTPVSLTEFMRFGLPVISVNVGGIPYLIQDGINGLLVNANDHEAMFQKINTLIEDQNLAQSIIKNAYDYTDRFHEKNVIKKWQALLNDN